MTPAINALKQHSVPFILHEYAHVSGETDFGAEAAKALGQAPTRIFKTLILELIPQAMVVACLPVSSTLNLKALADTCGAKKAALAHPSKIPGLTGYILGGVSPMGQKRTLRTFIDASASNHNTIFVSGGRRGLEIEIAPDDLVRVCSGLYANLD